MSGRGGAVLDHLLLLAALATALLPGAALVFALRIRSPLLLVALVPSMSIGVLLTVATVTALVGLPFSWSTVGTTVATLVVVGLLRQYRSGSSLRCWKWRTDASAAVGLLGIVGGGFLATRMWLRGFGGLDRIPQEHDMITHLVVVSYIERTGRAAAWLIRPVDLLTGSPVTYYPAGAHLAPALLGLLGPGPVAALNAMTVIYLAVFWVLSVAVLTAVAARRLRAGTGTAWLAAGTAAVIAPALYRPGVQLMHDGGIYAGAVALALAPGLLAALLLAPEELRPRTAIGLGFAAAGLVAVHPSAAATVGLSLLAWLVGDLTVRGGARQLVRSLPVLLGAGAMTALLVLPLLQQGGGSVGATGAFRPERVGYPLGDALGSAIGLVYGGYLDPTRAVGLLGLTVIYLVGAMVVVRVGGGLGPVLAWAVWAAVTVSTMLAPGAGPARLITGLFYNDLPRVWSHVSLFVPTLAALGIVLIATTVVARLRRNLPLRVRAWPTASMLVLAAMVLLLVLPVSRAVTTNTATIASRYATPDFVRVGTDDLAALDFLRARVAPGERILNSANDGSTILYVEAGLPVVNATTLGTGAAPYTYELMRSFNRYPADPGIRRMLRDLDVSWVYVDEQAPGIGAGGAPAQWVDSSQRFTVPPGFTGLPRTPLPGMTLAFRSGSVSVYRLDLAAIGAPA